ncbi:hypothetical protein [Paenibacillus massiliensis]|uniref:hypothetical protein n=1 Tax=Paenibacillus massiliensis TaxID=225917 RepID=UPI00040AAE50|nr:hypothetical protein [Paenibacillus massiliensis]
MIKSIVATDTLEELTKQIQAASDVNELRTQLIAEYHRLFHYTNIIEWNELVRVCEALAITGWGQDLTPAEAIAENGSTVLIIRSCEHVPSSSLRGLLAAGANTKIAWKAIHP